MLNPLKHVLIYVTLATLTGLPVSVAQAKQSAQQATAEPIVLDQAQLDQILAPIALYPDTLLSHILVASTYPLEIVQAARWRKINEDLTEEQILDAVENKNWDPSVKALTPFNDLLQKLSDDLDWLQSLGSAFLANEQQLLSSVQNLRQKAYNSGNLIDNDYVKVEQQDQQIIIETVRKEVVYVPYYDTRVVYGDWWWDRYQPIYWHRPRHSVYSAGLYWSVGFSIFPRFYFGGFHWRDRYLVANYHYRHHAKRHWSHYRDTRKRVRVTEYPRWSHNKQHRRGAQYRLNGEKLVLRSTSSANTAGYLQKSDKKRVLQVSGYRKEKLDNASQIKQQLQAKRSKVNTKVKHKADKRKVLTTHKQTRQSATKPTAKVNKQARQAAVTQSPAKTYNKARSSDRSRQKVQVTKHSKQGRSQQKIRPVKHHSSRERKVERRERKPSRQK